MALTIVGGFQGTVPRIAEVLLIALLIPLHLLIVKATHEVCTLWQAADRPPTLAPKGAAYSRSQGAGNRAWMYACPIRMRERT